MNFVRITCAVSLGVAGFVLPAHAADAPPVSPSTLPPVPEAKLFRGDDQVMRAPAPTKPVTGAANSFKFEEAPISDVAHLVLRDILKVDYVLHQPLLGSVTMSTSGSVPADQAIHLLETALQANGLLLARDARGVYHVGKPESLRAVVSLPRQANASGPLAPGYGPLIISPRFVGASELANILRPILPADAVMRVDTVRNLLVLVGTRAQVEGWLDIANTFDVDLLKGMSVGVFPLKYATVQEVEAALQLMASAAGSNAASRPGTATGAAAARTTPNPANPTGAPTGTAASRAAAAAQAVAGLPESFPLYGAIRVLPIERMNSVIIVTPRAAYLEEARKWIERLDQPGYSAGESQLFVYRVQNGSARHLADVLNGVFGGTSATASTPTTGVAPGLTPTQGSTGLGGARTSNATATSAGPTQNRSVTAATFASGVRVVADEINNSVLIYGSLSEYRKIESTLKRLDIAPTQVMIEASIVEVTLNDTLKYGLQWAFSDSRSNGDTGRGVLSTTAGGALGGALAGFSYTVTNSAGAVRAVLNALADKSLIKVISSPSLMVLDNHTASIVVGDQQPIRTSTTVTDGGVQTNSIQYKDTGVALTVTPSVNAGNIVTMNVSQSVTDIGPVDEGVTDQRSFLQRQVTSKVAVRSGEAIVLGGLIRDNDTRSRSGVPLLQDVPVFGGLFGTTNNSGRRTELLVVITPRVVRTDVDASAVGEELRDRMAGVRRMMEDGARDGAVLAPEPPLAPSGTDPVQ